MSRMCYLIEITKKQRLTLVGELDVVFYYVSCNKLADNGTTITVITPTKIIEILAMAASVSPNSMPTETPKACPADPKAKPFAIGLLM